MTTKVEKRRFRESCGNSVVSRASSTHRGWRAREGRPSVKKTLYLVVKGNNIIFS